MEERVDEFELEETDKLSQFSAASPHWTGAPSITLAHQLNEQCVGLVCELAATSLSPELPPFIMRNRDLWRLIEIDARKRVADFPFVIVDLRFKDVESWQRAGEGQLMGLPDSSHYNAVPPKLFEDLLLETLLFARQAAREDTSVAKAMFGMTSLVASLIASLTLPQVRAIAMGNSQHLRVRWDNDPYFWGDLLVACRSADERVLAAVRRQGKLLFCGEIVSLGQ
jgi:hypothetical protein